MSKLDELIQKLCPDGVEHKELHVVLTIKNGRDYKGFAKGNVPVYGSGGIMTYIDTFAYDKPSVLIPRKGSLDKLYYVETPFWNVDTIFYTEINTNLVEPKFVFYCLQMLHLERLKKAGGVPSLAQTVLNKVKIPVPPLEVQREIVRVLDYFTELISELTAELAARKKQYEYYWDELLQSHDMTQYTVDELIKLGMIEEPYDGNHGKLHPKKADYVQDGIPFIMVNDLQNGSVNYEQCAYITEEQAHTLRKGFAKPGDVLLTHKGTIGRTAIVPSSYDLTILSPQITYYRVIKGINNRYLKYYFDSSYFQNLIKKISDLGGRRAHIGITAQHALPIFLPDLERQNLIVEILDRFEILCNDIAAGLPAEIEARRKQYEYYRDKLLTLGNPFVQYCGNNQRVML